MGWIASTTSPVSRACCMACLQDPSPAFKGSTKPCEVRGREVGGGFEVSRGQGRKGFHTAGLCRLLDRVDARITRGALMPALTGEP